MLVEVATRVWTLAELHALPDDGNKYEVIDGELLVTPPPTDDHETILARLTRLLDPYVAEQQLGYVYRARAVFRLRRGSEVEPDLMVRQRNPDPKRRWEKAPIPSLVVEVLSPSTARNDNVKKRDFYLRSGIPEYWIVDGKARSVRIIRRDQPDVETTTRLRWHPSGAAEPLLIALNGLFE